MVLQKELGLSDGDAGWAASAFMLGYFISAPVFGYLGDRFPRKYLMLGGVLVWSLATAASGLAENFGQLFAIRIVVGGGAWSGGAGPGSRGWKDKSESRPLTEWGFASAPGGD